MPTIKPVAPDARLSLIEHLDELRSRLILSIITFVLAFGLCYWQNHQILDWLNVPLADANHIDCKDRGKANDSLERSGCFNEAVANYLGSAAPALTQAGATLRALATQEGVAQATRSQAQQAQRALQSAARQATLAARLKPKASSGRGEPVTLGVTEPFLTTITVAGYSALLLALPFLLFQAYAFVLPAFTGPERRLALPVMLMVPTLFVSGVAFGYFLALPRAVEFLQNYNDGQYDILVQARDYYRFVTLLLAALGLLFQIPIAVLAIVRLQILTPKQLRATRGYALLLFAVIAAVVTPTPDPFTMLIAMAPLVVLYEVSIQLARFVAPTGPSRWSWNLGPEDDDEDEDGGVGAEDDDGPRDPDAPAARTRATRVPDVDDDLD